MKRNFLKLRSWAVIALIGSFTFTSCSDDDDNGGSGDGNEDEIVMENGTTLSGEIASGKTVILSSGYRFKLSGGYAVKNGAKLKIEKGVILTAVKDDIADYILVEQGGYIDAQGTADDPIIMTAEDQTPGGGAGSISADMHIQIRVQVLNPRLGMLLTVEIKRMIIPVY